MGPLKANEYQNEDTDTEPNGPNVRNVLRPQSAENGATVADVLPRMERLSKFTSSFIIRPIWSSLNVSL